MEISVKMHDYAFVCTIHLTTLQRVYFGSFLANYFQANIGMSLTQNMKQSQRKPFEIEGNYAFSKKTFVY